MRIFVLYRSLSGSLTGRATVVWLGGEHDITTEHALCLEVSGPKTSSATSESETGADVAHGVRWATTKTSSKVTRSGVEPVAPRPPWNGIKWADGRRAKLSGQAAALR